MVVNTVEEVEQRLEDVLCGVVNTEPKQVTTLLLRGNWQSFRNLAGSFSVIKKLTWTYNFCHQSSC